LATRRLTSSDPRSAPLRGADRVGSSLPGSTPIAAIVDGAHVASFT
jgi:hypothetical protein